MTDDIPQWAHDRVSKLVVEHGSPTAALYALVAEHEEPPVDPLLVEAREIVRASYPEMDPAYTGRRVSVALTALRRGMELARHD